MKRGRSHKLKPGPGPPSVRLPLPRKTGKRHGERKTYDRQKEKARLKRLKIEEIAKIED
jgi:hypothetical protein